MQQLRHSDLQAEYIRLLFAFICFLVFWACVVFVDRNKVKTQVSKKFLWCKKQLNIPQIRLVILTMYFSLVQYFKNLMIFLILKQKNASIADVFFFNSLSTILQIVWLHLKFQTVYIFGLGYLQK
jgi:hypothetical protein